MRPDNFDWHDKTNHVSLRFLPHRSMPRTLWRWMVLAVMVQAIVTVILLMALQVLPWGSASTSDREIKDIAVAVGLSVLGVWVGIFPWMWHRMRRWSRGMSDLYKSIRGFAQGAELRPLSIGGDDEVGYLSVAFNEMAGRLMVSHRALREANRNLEQQVERRTAQWREASRMAEEANRAKSMFLATMSHEFRTPLHGILGSLALLGDTSLERHQSQLVRSGQLSANVLLNLINDVLDMSSIEAGQLELNEQPLRMQEVVEEAIAVIASLANQKGIHVTHRVEMEACGLCEGDKARVRQVLINLLNNAIKCTDAGYVEVHVSMESSHDWTWRVEVRDTGIGIPPDQIAHLFTRFSRVTDDVNPTRGGTGLGLAICRHLVERMGGEIGVTSTPGQGSTFWFTLAMRQLEPPDRIIPQDAVLRVLLIEACPASERMIRHYLEPFGHEVTQVDDYKHATQAEGSQEPFDLVLIGRRASLGMNVKEGLQQLAEVASKFALLTDPREEMDAAWGEGVTILHDPLMAGDLMALMSSQRVSSGRSEKNRPRIRSGVRVLLTEDNPVNQFITYHMLESLGVMCDVVASGEEAIQALLKQRYDLVLMDYLMPGMNGCAAAQRIREMETAGELSGRVPILALTANVMSTDRDECVQAGMDGYLAKPINIDQLYDALVEHTEGSGNNGTIAVAESAAAPLPIDIPHLEQICSNNPETLDKLLKVIDNRFRAFRREVMDIETSGTDEEARRLGHTIAGSALQSTAAPLADAARALERSTRDNRRFAVTAVAQALDACLVQVEARMASSTYRTA